MILLLLLIFCFSVCLYAEPAIIKIPLNARARLHINSGNSFQGRGIMTVAGSMIFEGRQLSPSAMAYLTNSTKNQPSSFQGTVVIPKDVTFGINNIEGFEWSSMTWLLEDTSSKLKVNAATFYPSHAPYQLTNNDFITIQTFNKSDQIYPLPYTLPPPPEPETVDDGVIVPITENFQQVSDIVNVAETEGFSEESPATAEETERIVLVNFKKYDLQPVEDISMSHNMLMASGANFLHLSNHAPKKYVPNSYCSNQNTSLCLEKTPQMMKKGHNFIIYVQPFYNIFNTPTTKEFGPGIHGNALGTVLGFQKRIKDKNSIGIFLCFFQSHLDMKKNTGEQDKQGFGVGMHLTTGKDAWKFSTTMMVGKTNFEGTRIDNGKKYYQKHPGYNWNIKGILSRSLIKNRSINFSINCGLSYQGSYESPYTEKGQDNRYSCVPNVKTHYLIAELDACFEKSFFYLEKIFKPFVKVVCLYEKPFHCSSPIIQFPSLKESFAAPLPCVNQVAISTKMGIKLLHKKHVFLLATGAKYSKMMQNYEILAKYSYKF